MQTKVKTLAFFIFSAGLGFLLSQQLNTSNTGAVAQDKADQPLYWVAPMDPNFRRPEPGLSPMGMELIPVYDSDGESSPGTVTISPEVENNLGVRTVSAQQDYFQTQIKTVGYVRYDEEKMLHVHPRVAGWIEKLYVKAAGDPVQQGQPLYELYSPTLVNAQEELLLALKRKNQRLIQAAEDRLSALNVPRATIKQLRTKQKIQPRIIFFAPQSGVIDKLNVREGFFAQPNTMLMSLGNLEQVWVDVEIFERQANEIKTGLAVTMKLPYLPGQQWQGKVDYIYPTLDPQTRTLKVRLRFDNPEQKLKPNMFAEVSIHLKDEQKSLLIPKEAIIRLADSERVVLALGAGKFKSVAVEVGRYDTQMAEIISGLEAGDQVVASAQFLIDSESAQSSDFKRMSGLQNNPTQNAVKAGKDIIWVSAVLNTINAEYRLLNVSHAPIKSWMRPAMTMSFPVAENVDLSALKLGENLYLQIDSKQNQPEIIAIQTRAKLGRDNSASSQGTIKSINSDNGALVINRASIEKWQRGRQQLEFSVLQNLDLGTLKTEEKIEFDFFVHNQELVLSNLITAESEEAK